MKILEKEILHFYWLDLLRFFAALTVVIAHTRGSVFVEYGKLLSHDKTFFITIAYAITRIANEAVIVFFVLSGFLVGGRALYRLSENKFDPAGYAVDRITRILLPLIPALFFTAFVRLTIDGNFDLVVMVANIFSLQGILTPTFGGNGPLWSLSYEVWFYFLTYSVGVTVLNKKLHIHSALIIILVLCIFTILDSVYLFCWLIGVMAYMRMPTRFSYQVLICSFLLLVYSVISIQIGTESISVGVKNIFFRLPSLNVSKILLSVAIALIIQQLIFIKPQKIITKVINDIGVALAAFSYTLYLTHYPTIQLLMHFGVKRADEITYTSVGIFVCVTLTCFFVGWVMYLLFERHTNLVRYYIKHFVFKNI